MIVSSFFNYLYTKTFTQDYPTLRQYFEHNKSPLRYYTITYKHNVHGEMNLRCEMLLMSKLKALLIRFNKNKYIKKV